MQRDMWQTSGKRRGKVGWQASYKLNFEGKEATDDSQRRILERKREEEGSKNVRSRSMWPRKKVLDNLAILCKEVVLR